MKLLIKQRAYSLLLPPMLDMHEIGKTIWIMKKKYGIALMLIFSVIFLMAQQQPLKPTNDLALVNTSVTNKAKSPRVGDRVYFVSKKNNKKFPGITNSEGKFSMLLPIGDTYLVEYKDFMEKVDYNEFTIPAKQSKYTMEITISYEPARVIVLQNVEYDFNKSTIRPSSYNTLNDLVEVMTNKPKLIIEIGGHTDDVGSDESNQILSLDRANAIKQYLVNKGVKADRIQTKGYGETQPIADNTKDDGRQKNRRTEVKIVKE